jgi:hypothetical protein
MTVRAFAIATLVIVSLIGCGGRQRPTEEGSCRAGREWVPPHQENGTWMDGYCRDAE